MLKVIKTWKKRNQTRRELCRLSDRELWDIGISRADIDRLVRETF